MIIVMQHKHQVPAPQTQMMIQTHSIKLHIWMIMMKKRYQIFQFLYWILMLGFNWTNSLNYMAGTPLM